MLRSTLDAPAPARRLRPEPLGRPFHVHLVSVCLANLCDGMVLVGIPLLAITLTRSPQEISLLQALFWLPWLVLGLVSGVVVDRLDRRTLRAAATAVRGLLLAATAVLAATGHLTMGLLIAFMGLYGVTQVFIDLAARTLVPQLVPASRLEAANGRTMAAERVFDDFIGRPVGGLLVVAGAGWLLGAAAGISVVIVLLLVLGLSGRFRAGDTLPGAAAASVTPREDSIGPDRARPAPGDIVPGDIVPGDAVPADAAPADAAPAGVVPGDIVPGDAVPADAAPAGVVPTAGSRRNGALGEVRDGLAFLFGHPVLRPVAIMAAVANFALSAYMSVFVLWVVGPGSAVGLTEAQYPLLMVAMAVGAVLATISVEALTRRLPEVPLMLAGWLAQVPLLMVPVAWPQPEVLLVAWVVGGFCTMTGNVLAMTLLQRLTPHRLLGRVNGSVSTLAFGLMPLGALCGGLAGQWFGLPVVFLGGATLLGAAVLYAMLAIARPRSQGHDAGPRNGSGPDAGPAPDRPARQVARRFATRRDGEATHRLWRSAVVGGGPGMR